MATTTMTAATEATNPPSDLSNHAKSNDGKMVVERVGQPYAGAFHDHEAGGIDGRQLVQIGAPEIRPGLIEVTRLAWEDSHGSQLIDRLFPCQRRVTARVAIEERERLDEDGNGRVEFHSTYVNVGTASRARYPAIVDVLNLVAGIATKVPSASCLNIPMAMNGSPKSFPREGVTRAGLEIALEVLGFFLIGERKIGD